ncbi:MAG: dTDP-4-dehydrorhamnose 3,5-epimerase [Rhodothermales bacterium]|nr:dTDP-4-dehydrorhamnose 3,5-epimerase [Rhodothermales bacterium]
MNIERTELEGVLIIEPQVFGDDRGFFMESWHARRYRQRGIPGEFVQDNISFSRKHVLRGLHFQNPSPQGKLVSVLDGEIFDVAVDIRTGSPTFGAWTSVVLSSEGKRQFFVPAGFAHGFVVLSDHALVNYKCTAYYDRAAERGIRWDDPEIGIAWPVEAPVLSPKDAAAPFLRDLPTDALFHFERRDADS